ncbi:hypothetical protein ACFL7M_05940 [Thermodesulfobacteriota bacterium]
MEQQFGTKQIEKITGIKRLTLNDWISRLFLSLPSFLFGEWALVIKTRFVERTFIELN